MIKNQKGLAGVVEVILIAVVLSAVGLVGYRVVQSRKTEVVNQPTAATTAKPKKTEAKKALMWKEGGVAVAGTYADASVVKISDTQWRLYYSIQPEVQGQQFEVYSATSSDGKTWTQEAGTRKKMATFPEVIKLADGRYRMYFQAASVLKSAISTDGLTFADEAGTRIDKTNADNLVFDNVAAPSVALQKDGSYVMVYRGTINSKYGTKPVPNQTTQLLMWAVSTDGLAFTKQGIAVDSRTETLNGQLDGPALVKMDEGYKLFATTYTGVYQFDFDGKAFTKPVLALAGQATQDNMGFHGSPPGDPTVAQIGKTWFMFYGGPRESNGIHYATLQ